MNMFKTLELLDLARPDFPNYPEPSNLTTYIVIGLVVVGIVVATVVILKNKNKNKK